MNLTKDVVSKEYIEELEALYNSVPSGKCLGCTNCCSESVNISFLEFANIIENGVANLDEATLSALKKRILEYYLKEWVELQKCPFLSSEKKCIIYDVRPLPCRIFGTPTKKAYTTNFTQIRAQNINLSKSIRSEYDLKVPREVIARKIDFCETYFPEQRLTSNQVDALYSKLINLDGKLYFKGLIDENAMNGDLVSWMIDWIIVSDAETFITKSMLYELKLDLLKSIQKTVSK